MSSLSQCNMLGRLSNELILVCDDDLVVREANGLAVQTLGTAIIDHSLFDLFSPAAQGKGTAFVAELQRLSADQITPTWELMLDVPHGNKLLIGIRGGKLPGRGWLIMGGGEPSGISNLYHEVLALNIELTTLIRKLSREQTVLNDRIQRLLDLQEQYNVQPH
ncbi:hypothetical protein [Candidatus Viridilinea mediisalina]|uniref:PAS fold-4 domain-containing protein n=1 Tax=Candidatus Viridilinea mediisalina TaxID=2024553 RepID=A0A2A6RG56_9CHLR|nr:hypothetical protein [Candidatus Viridilinea mediisalina]PDW02002.1 hypothetical protein CJ255_16160 [Candidatus Viridilinea mediisalina]